MSDIALVKIRDRSNSYSREDHEMHSFDNSVHPGGENGGFVDEQQLPVKRDKAESVIGERTSGIGTHSLSSDISLLDFGLHQAAREGAVGILKSKLQEIVDEGQDVLRVIEVKDADGFTPLHHAAKCNRKDALILLIDSGSYLDARGEDENTPLHLAAKYNSVMAAKILIQRGAGVNIPNMYGTTALHFAARRGNTEIGLMLVNQPDIEINICDHGYATPLHSAAISGDSEITEQLIKYGADIFKADVEEETALHYAAEEGNVGVIDVILKSFPNGGDEVDNEPKSLEKIAFINRKSSQYDTPLHLACTAGYRHSVEKLIKHGANVNVLADGNVSPLHVAAANGSVKVARTLLVHGAKINARDEDQVTPLHRAATFGNTNMIKFLLERGAAINHKDKDNYTPLLTASWKGQTEAVVLLIQKGAKVQATDSSLKSCLHLAVEHDNSTTLEALLENGAAGLVNATDKNYKTPLHCAAHEGNLKALEMLLKHGAKADFGDNLEQTPLHIAAMNGKPKCVTLLCKAAPVVMNASDEKGRMPLHLAAMRGNIRAVKNLVDRGAEIDARDDIAWTPLDYAAKNGFYKSMHILLENDAPVDAKDKNDNTPLHWAASCGHVQCVSMLLDYGADISQKNNNGKNCLDLAIDNFQRETCMGLVTHPRWREVMDNVDIDGIPPMRKLIKTAPKVAEVVLDKCISRSKHPSNDPDYSITYDFRYIDQIPGETFEESHSFEAVTMAKYNRENLLSHPVTKKLMAYKWARLGRFIYYTTLALYLVFVLGVTSVVVVERERDRNEELDKIFKNITIANSHKRSNSLMTSIAFSKVLPSLTVVICAFNIVKELFQMIIQKGRYFLKGNNYLEWTLYISTMVFMLDFLIDKDAITFTQKWNAGAISVFLTWVNLLLFLTRFPYFGVYVEMFVEVLGTVLRVLVVFGIFIIAFSLSFFSLLRELPTFHSVERSLMKVAVMTIGELEYDNIITDTVGKKDATTGLQKVPMEGITYVLYSIFLLLMPIILMNLLVGLAVGDIEAVRKTAYTRILKQQVEILQDMERNYPKFIQKWAHTKMLVFYPNRQNLFERFRRNLGYDDEYSYWKDDQAEQTGHEEVLNEKLIETQEELAKHKKHIKSLKNMIKEQGLMLKLIAAKLEVDDSDSEGE